MRKLIFALLAVLLIAGMAYAVSIPQSEFPTEGPYIWTVPVYNNTTSTMDVGDCVIWDIGSSTGDDDNYVDLAIAGEEGTYLTAGVVVGNDIPSYGMGQIAVHGVVSVDTASTGQSVGAGDILFCGIGGNAGRGYNGTFTTGWQYVPLGQATAASSSGAVKVYLKGN